MSPRGLPPEIREFLYAHFESVDGLEALLLIFRSKEAWTPARLAADLGVPEDDAMDVLVALHYRGFLSHNGQTDSYLFAARSDELARGVAELARLPAARLLAELEATLAPKSFADAFRLRPARKHDKDKKDG